MQETLLNKMKNKIHGKELKLFSFFSVILLLTAGFTSGSPMEIAQGMKTIVFSRDALITDYFELAGYGAAFFNAAMILSICIGLVIVQKIPFTGLTMAALFINAGYGLWGKNPVNILPVLLGTWLYAKMHRAHMSRYIYTALFGTCLSPFVTEMVYLLPFHWAVNLVFAVLLGIFVGFVLPPLSMHTASMHMGYNLFNVGFSGGILAFVVVCVLKSFGLESESVFIWKEGRPMMIVVGMYLYFAAIIILGLVSCGGDLKEYRKILKHPGRAVADFVIMNGPGATLINMGSMGMIALTYVMLVGGDLSGPVIGAILTVVGFSAFGAHAGNYLPVLLGVFLSTFLTQYTASTPGILLAAMFAVGLSPIAGQFGVIPGIFAGFLHSAIVMCTSSMYGGLNLYNNGFSAGWVAIIMIPVLESFMKHFETRKHRKDGEKHKAFTS
ncbi:MAG: DUF1576 domain-containing protein [Lachnospiraceae bacterium]|nr:DUF1576 domain-containing protein [Lachnospiraceae bacterium]